MSLINISNVILHIPHSSTNIPFYDGYLKPKGGLREEIQLLTDWFTDELFNLPYKKIITPFSRIFCDVERFAEDSQEVMSKYGMGMCYTQLDNGEAMRNVSPELRSRIKSDYYDNHHNHLEVLCADLLEKSDKILIIDCHSFPDEPFKRDLDKELPRPDFCIGTDEFHTQRELVESSIEFLTTKGYQVKENSPFSGTMIPIRHYQRDNHVLGIMIEVNRKLYMTKKNGIVRKTDRLDSIHQTIKELIMKLVEIISN